MRLKSIGLAGLGVVAVASSYPSSAPRAAESDMSGQGASVGARLIELGPNAAGGSSWVAHGYAAPELKVTGGAPDARASESDKATQRAAANRDVVTTGSVSTATGEFVFRIRDLCVTAADAHVIPIGLQVQGQGVGDAVPKYFVTDVKVDISDQGQCATAVKVTYGLNLSPSVKLRQVGYTVFLTGSKRGADSKPEILPRTPL